MPKRAFHIEQYIRPTPSGASLVLARLTGTSGSAASRVSDKVMENFASAGSACSILGLYSGSEVYGG
jgi:hypothetical protein